MFLKPSLRLYVKATQPKIHILAKFIIFNFFLRTKKILAHLATEK